MGSSSPMALQKSFTLPASTVVLKGLNSWPITFLSSCIVFPPLSHALSSLGLRPRDDNVVVFDSVRVRALLVAADDGHAGHVLARRAAQIVGHADARILQLAGAGAALELQVHLVEHAQAGGADRMAEAFQPAVDLAGDLAVGVVEAVEHVLPALAGFGDVEVFHGH